MSPIWLRTTHHTVEIVSVIIILGLAGLVMYDAVRLGPTWGERGPQPGFFPFALASMMVIGVVGVLAYSLRAPDRRPFFEVEDEVRDLLKVAIPILVVVTVIRWLGLYVTSGLYLGFFMAWYGRFPWYQAILGAFLLPLTLWLTLRYGFNLNMPMSVFYRSGYLPF
jgi:putative tricarboxylic transport membrane protein